MRREHNFSVPLRDLQLASMLLDIIFLWALFSQVLYWVEIAFGCHMKSRALRI